MVHSYEEIRQCALDILGGKEDTGYTNNQIIHFRNNVTDLLKKREEKLGQTVPFSKQDDQYFQEVFWELFRQGIITLGTENDLGQGYPYFRLSSFGQQLIDNKDVYFFHDLSSYERLIRENIPEIDDITLFYLKEAMQAFIVGCRLSSACWVSHWNIHWIGFTTPLIRTVHMLLIFKVCQRKKPSSVNSVNLNRN